VNDVVLIAADLRRASVDAISGRGPELVKIRVPAKLSHDRCAPFVSRRPGGKLWAIMPEINTLPPKPRKILGWAWMFMMVTALLAAIGRALFR